MISAGPFPIQLLVVVACALLAWLTAYLTARRLPNGGGKATGALMFDVLLWGLVAARIGYIIAWWPEYAAAPWSMIAIGDQGFLWWVGALAALLYVLWRTRLQRRLRLPLLVGLCAGLVCWWAASASLEHMRRAMPPLPALQLAKLDGQPVALDSYLGQPVVLNLWATWCPPCRREMPVFEQAQAEYPGIAFVLVNQGESAQQAHAFLTAQGLQLSDVLLDPRSQTMQAIGSQGLPTTLFFDATGRLVDSHMGELSMASLKSTLTRRFAPHQLANPHKE
ncbi:TlpA family protein disulfide reductase [Lampropedia aestuarii]|uniref:TlpA family protein disulfide reductase n=1 Tax=Lampropedia aestuarii TaxID=2562762 RepID=A0A4S5BSE9_9BURK|nr:TlpA disulfide reductase family protein [Lampropedia aestuarii]THJ33961.1 TlpA family protein disulfide reductase [Lampropedia aestuarii]